MSDPFKDLCKNVTILTHNNCHNQAVLAFAEYMCEVGYANIMQSIISIHNSYGCMNTDLIDIRKEILKYLFFDLERGQAIKATELRKCF